MDKARIKNWIKKKEINGHDWLNDTLADQYQDPVGHTGKWVISNTDVLKTTQIAYQPRSLSLSSFN